MMKKLILCISVCLMLLCACGRETVSTQTGEAVFGTFTAVDLAGEPVDETVFSGHKLTMVNVWATFCGPCVEEMPDLAVLNEAFGEEFQVIGIPLDTVDRNGQILPEKKAEACSLAEAAGAGYRHILPVGALQAGWLSQIQSVPQTVFVNSRAEQIGQVYMGAKSRDAWHRIIETLLESMP